MTPSSYLELADYRHRMAEIYTRTRDSEVSPADRWHRFRSDKDDLFKYPPQSPLAPEQRIAFTSLRYYPYNLALRFALPVEPIKEQEVIQINLRDDGLLQMKRFGNLSCKIIGQSSSLTLFWIMG